ncbi:MAG TPA: hypothetical protein ENK97_03865 [Campylobacteraceae bacterium]|nr:hypothetical protein [Campylobacteraceae bacterium]
MADKGTKRYMELQMEELKETYGSEEKDRIAAEERASRAGNPKDAEIAALYEDCAEYEADLEAFESELAIIEERDPSELVAALDAQKVDSERAYAQELKKIVEHAWEAEADREAYLNIVKEAEFSELIEKLNNAFPGYSGDFKEEIRSILIERWKMLIEIKKEHIKEEISEIKVRGLKPGFAKRIYKQYHGIE